MSNVNLSLLLDGKIGVKMYFELGTTDYNAKFKTVAFDTVTSTAISEMTLTPQYDETKEMYYVTVYIAPKDIDDVEIRGTLTSYGFSREFDSVKVTDYIKAFKELAKTDVELAKALPLIEALESYAYFADGYFSDEETSGDVIVDESFMASITAPSKTGRVTGVEHFATSLVLESGTTLRHYFKITDNKKHNFEIQNKPIEAVNLGESIWYIDVANIAAQDLDERYIVTVDDALSIAFTPLNYAISTMNSSENNLSNLVKALFNYWYEANEYAK